eukprot:COSAG06_NODE_54089_length_296_cov_1.045685_1_plen_22_part_10
MYVHGEEPSGCRIGQASGQVEE